MHLMRRIQLFLRRANMAPTRFGREAVGDPRLISDLRNGRNCVKARPRGSMPGLTRRRNRHDTRP